MGLLHSIFGGGTGLQLTLDNHVASPGGVIGGRIVLGGGTKPRQLTELTAKLCSVELREVDYQTEPEVDVEVLETQVVAGGIQLAPGAQMPFTFRLTVPDDLEPSGSLEYKVVATADIPGVADPEAEVSVTLIEASDDDVRPLSLHEIVERFPDLHSREEARLCEALNDFYIACHNEGARLMEGEQLIGYHMMNGTVRVRREALKAWANLVDNRVQPHHLQVLYTLANTPGLSEETFKEVIVAATKFAEEGSLPLVQQLAQHPDPNVRGEVAWNLDLNAADKFNGKRELLIQLARDPDGYVRSGAVSSLSDYLDEQGIAQWIAQFIDSDPEPVVQSAGIVALYCASDYGLTDFALAVYEKHLQNPNPGVRKTIAGALHFMPKEAVQRVGGLAQRLAQDPDEMVRDALATEFHSLDEMPQLLPIAQYMAQNDPSIDVRRTTIGAMSALMAPQQAAAFYGQLFGQARDEDDLLAIIIGLREHGEHPEVRRLLTHISQLPVPPEIVDAAREAMS
ncbi:HEAT repeat domain-containing protein [Pendulispora brunnea]|uniref:HEAT repeat domain-containing protein n=1 Tax=Pendulispora brunnea TaxID=2905690 RepID=A0ABZ2JYQ6_9BACT